MGSEKTNSQVALNLMRVVIYQACYMSFDDGDGRADEVEYKLRFISNVF